MKRILRKLLEALYFLLCFGPVPLLVGYAAAGGVAEPIHSATVVTPAAAVTPGE